MSFEVNRGQAQPGIDFIARGGDYDAYLGAGWARLRLNYSDPSVWPKLGLRRNSKLRFNSLAVMSSPRLFRKKSCPAAVIIYSVLTRVTGSRAGRNIGKWDTGTYIRASTSSIPGNQNQLEHDFVVHPAADAAQICVVFSGTQKAELDARGDLVLRVVDAEFRLEKPRALPGDRRQGKRSSSGNLQRLGCAAFRLGGYDASHELVIDPVLVYATFLGGNTLRPVNSGLDGQAAYAVTLEGLGNLYLAGNTNSLSFPVTSGVVGASVPKVPMAAFVSKINPAGTSVVYSTSIGGFDQYINLKISSSDFSKGDFS